MSERQPLFVTRAYLPPREEFLRYVDEIFNSRRLTNQGALARELEARLAAFLGTPHLLSCSNGTLGLQLSLRLADLAGKKVITTPFTYVATLSAILWEGCIPVFADIDPDTLCLSPDALSACLKRHPDAAAVLPVHVFGNACDVRAIDGICKEHGLVCIYDACHAFGANLEGRSLLEYGDYAVCSFHATKLFHTVEGGCLVAHDAEALRRAELLRAFGHHGDEHFSLGINAKLSELHAAMGLAVLPRIPEIIAALHAVRNLYERLLPPDCCTRPKLAQGVAYNYSYFPILLESESVLLALCAALARRAIFPRRYFYPSLTKLPYLPQATRAALETNPCPAAEDIASRILCLPSAADLAEEEATRVGHAVRDFFALREHE